MTPKKAGVVKKSAEQKAEKKQAAAAAAPPVDAAAAETTPPVPSVKARQAAADTAAAAAAALKKCVVCRKLIGNEKDIVRIGSEFVRHNDCDLKKVGITDKTALKAWGDLSDDEVAEKLKALNPEKSARKPRVKKEKAPKEPKFNAIQRSEMLLEAEKLFAKFGSITETTDFYQTEFAMMKLLRKVRQANAALAVSK